MILSGIVAASIPTGASLGPGAVAAVLVVAAVATVSPRHVRRRLALAALPSLILALVEGARRLAGER